MSSSRIVAVIMCVAIIGTAISNGSKEVYASAVSQDESAGLAFDNAAWQYDVENDVYWQIGVTYCLNPEAPEYEALGIYVPGAYMDAEANGDETFTCELNEAGEANGYTAATAPIVMPVNTPGYSAQAAPAGYNFDSIAAYIESGFIYVQAGCRGRDNGYDEEGNLIYSGGAPWGVTDLKAAVRYLRYNEAVLPGDGTRIFTFGHSGGGAQSSLMGAAGDSELYLPYLESIGAAMTDTKGNLISDAITGAMCWWDVSTLNECRKVSFVRFVRKHLVSSRENPYYS